jgi:hypothetical protein
MEPLPDGNYQVVVDKAELKRSKDKGNPMLEWTLRVVAPHHIGRLMWKRNMIVTSDNVAWLKADLMTCGLALEKLSDLSQRLKELLSIGLTVAVRTKGEFTNVYFNDKIDGLEDPGTANGNNVPF